jgi:hypothetical protein
MRAEVCISREDPELILLGTPTYQKLIRLRQRRKLMGRNIVSSRSNGLEEIEIYGDTCSNCCIGLSC